MKLDSEIQQSVLQELRWDPRVDETDVGVEVDDGIVTLSGTVDSYVKRLAAQQAAHHVIGVLDVANDIQVKIPGDQGRTDTEIAQAVRHALEADTEIPSRAIRTTVVSGRVSLEGEVELWHEREAAERAVERLAGVLSVVNLIRVVPPVADQDLIKEEIEDALERRAERAARHIEVAARDGVVTLSGSVHSWPEKRAVIGAARFTRGVHQVVDRLRIAPEPGT
jgi:osmotically-inducible protein OsmY